MADIKEIKNLQEYEEFVGAPGLHVLKIGASWCGPCRTLEQTLKSFNEEEVSGVFLGEVNADDEWFDEIADGLNIRGIPVLIAFNGGEEKERILGAAQRLAIMDFFGRNK